MSGTDVLDSLIRYISKEIPVFVHSANIARGPIMADRLEVEGFWVIRVPMYELTRKRLLEWIEEVRELWEERDFTHY
jgi:hypothetical protein